MAARRPPKVSGNYASGIAIPFQVDGDGGIVVAEGDEYIKGMILAAVQPNYSDNPFQDIGGTEDPVFQNPDDPTWRQAYKRRIRETFKRLERENLARLVSANFRRTETDGAEVTLEITYINLETTQQQTVSATVTSVGSLGTASQVPTR